LTLRPFDEGVLAPNGQPAASTPEGDVGAACIVSRSPPNSAAGFSTMTERPEFLQRIRGAEAGGARADDGNVD
jgi:hypothetical protein